MKSAKKEKISENDTNMTDFADIFIKALAERDVVNEIAKKFLNILDVYCGSHYLYISTPFQKDHPVEESGR